MRILGIDYGDARIGLSVSDETGTIAGNLPTLQNKSMRTAIDSVASVCARERVSQIVIGLPLCMDGSKGARAGKTEAFGRVLQKVTELPVVYQDERLSTVSAEKSLYEGTTSRKKIRSEVDSVAAQIILQRYLDKNKMKI